MYGDADIVTVLLEAGATADAVDGDGSTPLHHADNALVAWELLKAGASVEVVNRDGDTPLHRSANRALAVVAWVLSAGA